MSKYVKPGSHIDTATGQNKRVKVTIKETKGPQPERKNGHVVNRAEFRRNQKTR